MTITRKLYIDNGLQGQIKECQLETGGIFYYRDSGLMKRSSTYKTLFQLDNDKSIL